MLRTGPCATNLLLRAALILVPAVFFGQGGPFGITNYRVVSQQPASETQAYVTYRADLVNSGPAVSGVTATLARGNRSMFQIVQGQNTLNFAPVPANSQTTSDNTFTILIDTSTFNFSSLQWTFQSNGAEPVANAGPNQTAKVGSTVTLNGSGSTNPTGIGTLTFSWVFASRPAGSVATLTNSTSPTPSFVVDAPGNYVLTLTVSNGIASSNSSVIVSTVNSPPVANAGPDQVVNVGTLVQLNGAKSTDVDGNPLTYQWNLVTVPSGSKAALSDPAAVNPTFTADIPGTYMAQLIVNDGIVNSAPATVTITTNGVLGPTANAGAPQTVVPGTTVTLNGTGFDPQGAPLTFQWALTAKPAGSTATLSNANIATPTFVADVPGTYIAQLVVNNGSMSSAPATVIISTISAPPVANAGPNQNSAVGSTVTLNGGASSDPGHQPLSYTWSFLSRPNGSNTSLVGADTMTPTFVPDVPGLYVVQLIVNNGFTNSSPSTVTITASAIPRMTLMPNPLKLSPGQTGTLVLTLPFPAGPGGVVIGLSSIDTHIATVPLTVLVPAGLSTANISVMGVCACPTPDGEFPGNTTIVATDASGAYQPGSAMVNVVAASITVALESGTVSVGQSVKGTLTLSAPAPAGGATVTLSAAPNGIVGMPPTVNIPAGSMMGSFTATGLAQGAATITASSAGFDNGTANLNVAVASLRIKLTPNPLTVSTSLPGTLLLTLPFPAGPGGVIIGLSSIDTNIATVPLLVAIAAGSTMANVPVTGVCACPTPDGASPGNTTIVATDASGAYQPGSAMVNVVAATISVALDSINVGVTRAVNGTVALSTPAPTGGVVVALSAAPNGIVDVQPATVIIIAGQTTGSFSARGLALGSVTITGSAAGYSSGSANLNVGSLGAILLPSNVTVAPNQSVPFPVTLAVPAPVGGVTITLMSSDTSLVQVPSSVFVAFGATAPTSQPQLTGLKSGSATINASSPGLSGANTLVSVFSGLSITTASLANGMVGASYSQTLMATGGTGPYTWKLTQGRLPPGLTLNSASGEISGVPTSESPGSTVTFQVMDSANPAQTASASFVISVSP